MLYVIQFCGIIDYAMCHSNVVKYKVLTIIFQCIKGSAPTYLKELINTEHNRHLRSTIWGNLPVRGSRLAVTSNCSIKIAGPRLWNDLPHDIKKFGFIL